MMSLQSQYLLCPPLSCSTALTHQQPKIATSGYFTWETGPWQQEKQHQCSRSPTNIGTDSQKPSPWKRITRQTSWLWRSTETSASTCKGPMVQQSKGLGPAKLEASLVQRLIKMHAAEKKWPYTCLQTPEWEGRKELRPSGRQFRRRKWGAISYVRKTQLVHIPANLIVARYRYEVLTPHMLPAMNLRMEVYQHDNVRPHTVRATVDFLANQNVRVLPGPLNHQIWTQ